MTGEPHIDYDALALEAMRGVVRTVLTRAAKSGLPGDHHFYVSFDTEAPGVIMSKRLKERYPRDMTIVLQHRFWDLVVTDERFEVKLTFDSIPERLVVPFAAIKVFFDPSVQYGLKFEDGDAAGDIGETTAPPAAGTLSGPRAVGSRAQPKKPRPAKKPRNGTDGIVSVAPTPISSHPVQLPSRAAPLAPVAAAPSQTASEAPSGPTNADPAEKPASGAQIVSLDQFRKK
ncbi:MAG: SspB family protein [Hyphomicrobium sp.]